MGSQWILNVYDKFSIIFANSRFESVMAEDSLFQNPNIESSEAQRALEREVRLPLTGWQQEVDRGLQYGLEAAASIRDRSISTFSRGELPHFAGITVHAPVLSLLLHCYTP